MTPKSRAAVSGDAGSGNEAYANDLADLAAGEPGPNGADDPNGDHPDSAGHPEGATRRRRRRTAPRAHGFWRLVFPVIVVASALAVALLAVSGFRTLLDSTVGTPENPGESNPERPRFKAFVAPTPTLLMLHTDAGVLTGVTLLVLPDADNAAVVLVSPELIVASADNQASVLREAYASGGADAVERLAEQLFGFGFEDVTEVPAESLAAAMQPAAPFTYPLLDELAVVDDDGARRVIFEQGFQQLDGAEAAQVYGFRNTGEVDAVRLQRQSDMWTVWIDRLRHAEDLSTVILPFREGLSVFLDGLARRSHTVEILPVTPVAGSVALYELGDAGRAWLTANGRRLVRWPTAPLSVARPKVEVLDGVGDQQLRNDVAQQIIDVGGIVTVMGNAEDFDKAETLVAYHRLEALADAERIAVALAPGGQGAGMAFVELGSAPDYADITVTVGADLAQP